MRGVCFQSVEHIAPQDLPDAVIEAPTDAIVQVDMAGLCGSDMHPFFGREIGLDVGTVMGHEFVGRVVETGSQVRSVSVGDRVCAPFTTSCGQCEFCRRGLTARCVDGQLFGWRQDGEGLHGGQAQWVRVPLAEGTLVPVPDGIADETALLVGDNFSTGMYCADLAEVQPGRVYAVVGCGTVGLLAIMAALLRGATQVFAYDPVGTRRQRAQAVGASVCDSLEAFEAAVRQASEGRGADGVMELVGKPDAQRLAYDIISPGGILATIGCHCTPNFSFSPAELYDKNLTYRSGRCPARAYMPRLMQRLQTEPIDLSWCVTHRFPLSDAITAYDTFAYQKDDCVKAVLVF
ncbi:alcohol dehydrogenase catalytic domain-containing protein [Roseimaritima ulvae]|uniref:NADP-dependent isopropanol dehydrogenase n=1 Tax=Roseimaritima ulvae TaxID=980254 RepID=A0A5B9QQA5_9BACT|nr:alcohol dehydrogenase catalytic domain-containing protein [Roseimaritima ulvae]QEG41188.1 NADP-dependent isopropanol dehydrogenase [Roseimaritima ulvae]